MRFSFLLCAFALWLFLTHESYGIRPASPHGFAVVVIIYNEEKRIPAFLAARGISDFRAAGGLVIFMDSGSTDGSLEYLRKNELAVHFISDRHYHMISSKQEAISMNQFVDEEGLIEVGERFFDFGGARREASSIVQKLYPNTMLLMVDIGDMVETLDYTSIAALIRSGINRFGYRHLLSATSDHHYQWVGRFYSPSNSMWTGYVHEALYDLDPEDGAPPVRSMQLAPNVLSVRNIRDPMRVRNYLPGLIKNCMEDPKRARWWHYLGRELHYIGLYDRARPFLLKHALREDVWNTERAASLEFIGVGAVAQRDYVTAIGAYAGASLLDPTRLTPWIEQAWISYIKGNYHACVMFAEVAVGIRSGHGILHEAQTSAGAHHARYSCLLKIGGRFTDARESWLAAKEIDPSNQRFVADESLFMS